MSISELNHFMTYVLDGWILFSAGFISIGFISFVSKRIQEDLEAEALALLQSAEEEVIEAQGVSENEEEKVEAARLKEVAAVSEELARTKSKQTKSKQTDTSSVSVST